MTDTPDDSKLTQTKSKWAQLGKFLTGTTSRPEDSRLPPGQHLVKNWPILDLGQTPRVARENWRSTSSARSRTRPTWTWHDLMSAPQAHRLNDIHCVTSWSRYDNNWDGVTTHDLMDAVQPRAEVTHVLLTSNDGYTTNLSLEDFSSPEAMLVHSWEGKPLELDHGGPGAAGGAAPLFLEERQMDPQDRVCHPRPPRLLGSPRLPQSRRSVAEERYS